MMRIRDWFKRFKRVSYSPICSNCDTRVWTYFEEATDSFWCRKCGKELFKNPLSR